MQARRVRVEQSKNCDLCWLEDSWKNSPKEQVGDDGGTGGSAKVAGLERFNITWLSKRSNK